MYGATVSYLRHAWPEKKSLWRTHQGREQVSWAENLFALGLILLAVLILWQVHQAPKGHGTCVEKATEDIYLYPDVDYEQCKTLLRGEYFVPMED